MSSSIDKIHVPGWVADFRAFIMRGNVIDLAVGVIIGAAFTEIVSSLVKNIFNPLIGIAIGGIDFSNMYVTLKGPATQTLAEAQKVGAVTINYGLFLNAVIQFLIAAFVVFWIVRLISRLAMKKPVEAAPAAPPREQVLLEEIRDILAKKS
ncbi:MAG: large conductance mechanosensitive channel protein MscL [Acetobacter sp.]|nr:large conductance mechanosensitive channel protein MscL [Acetobacter sp.]